MSAVPTIKKRKSEQVDADKSDQHAYNSSEHAPKESEKEKQTPPQEKLTESSSSSDSGGPRPKQAKTAEKTDSGDKPAEHPLHCRGKTHCSGCAHACSWILTHDAKKLSSAKCCDKTPCAASAIPFDEWTKDAKGDNNNKRFACYKQLAALSGKKQRSRLAVCVEVVIKEKFPSAHYTGFKPK